MYALAEHFFTFFELTKLWSLAPLREAIAEGVREGLFAYAVGISGEGAELRIADPALIKERVSLPPDEVDLGPGAALLSPETAAKLRPTPPLVGRDEGSGSAEGPEAGETLPERHSSPVKSAVTTPIGEDGASRVRLDISATEDDLLTIQKALGGLRDIVKPGVMRITLAVEAERPDGLIDPIQFQNRVRQHLEEDQDVSFGESWG